MYIISSHQIWFYLIGCQVILFDSLNSYNLFLSHLNLSCFHQICCIMIKTDLTWFFSDTSLFSVICFYLLHCHMIWSLSISSHLSSDIILPQLILSNQISSNQIWCDPISSDLICHNTVQSYFHRQMSPKFSKVW